MASATPYPWCLNGTAGCPNTAPAADGHAVSPYGDYTDVPIWSVTYHNNSSKRAVRTMKGEGLWTTPVWFPQ